MRGTASIKDVANKAGVSVATVSHVINKTRYVSQETRALVQKAIDELQYRPNSQARSLRWRGSRTLGVLIPDNANPFTAELLRAIEDTLSEEDFAIFLGNSDSDSEKEIAYINLFLNKQVDGIILLAAVESQQAITAILEARVPAVVINRDSNPLCLDTVLVDNQKGGYLAARHLIELGHRRIACITGPGSLSPSQDRFKGYCQALQEASIPLDPSLVVTGSFDLDSGYQACQALLSQATPPTAIFAFDDMMALGAMRAAVDLGLKIPENLSVIGFDDIALARTVIPRLTTIHQPSYEMGEMVAELILPRLRDREAPPVRKVVPVSLVHRESTGPVQCT